MIRFLVGCEDYIVLNFLIHLYVNASDASTKDPKTNLGFWSSARHAWTWLSDCSGRRKRLQVDNDGEHYTEDEGDDAWDNGDDVEDDGDVEDDRYDVGDDYNDCDSLTKPNFS